MPQPDHAPDVDGLDDAADDAAHEWWSQQGSDALNAYLRETATDWWDRYGSDALKDHLKDAQTEWWSSIGQDSRKEFVDAAMRRLLQDSAEQHVRRMRAEQHPDG